MGLNLERGDAPLISRLVSGCADLVHLSRPHALSPQTLYLGWDRPQLALPIATCVAHSSWLIVIFSYHDSLSSFIFPRQIQLLILHTMSSSMMVRGTFLPHSRHLLLSCQYRADSFYSAIMSGCAVLIDDAPRPLPYRDKLARPKSEAPVVRVSTGSPF